MNINDNQYSYFRIIDAAANRATEGLRVLEDYARMHLCDRYLAGALKQMRHALVQVISPIDSIQLIRNRDTVSDVGTTISTETEYQRIEELDIIRANFSRVQQALRTIEEYSKGIASEELYRKRSRSSSSIVSITQEVEKLRYDSYSLEKALVNTLQSRSQLTDVSIYVLTDARSSLSEFETLVRELIDADVDLIQLRDKTLDDRQLVEAGKLLSMLTRDRRTRWIMNDRSDLALLSGADGVHVGQTDLSVQQVRQIVGAELIVGVSTHNIEQARQAEFDGATYIGVGPLFPSKTKSFDQFADRGFLRSVVDEISLPAFAIGGINQSNIDQLLEEGIERFAVSNSVINSDAPGQTVKALKKQLSRAERTLIRSANS